MVASLGSCPWARSGAGMGPPRQDHWHVIMLALSSNCYASSIYFDLVVNQVHRRTHPRQDCTRGLDQGAWPIGELTLGAALSEPSQIPY